MVSAQIDLRECRGGALGRSRHVESKRGQGERQEKNGEGWGDEMRGEGRRLGGQIGEGEERRRGEQGGVGEGHRREVDPRGGRR